MSLCRKTLAEPSSSTGFAFRTGSARGGSFAGLYRQQLTMLTWVYDECGGMRPEVRLREKRGFMRTAGEQCCYNGVCGKVTGDCLDTNSTRAMAALVMAYIPWQNDSLQPTLQLPGSRRHKTTAAGLDSTNIAVFLDHFPGRTCPFPKLYV